MSWDIKDIHGVSDPHLEHTEAFSAIPLPEICPQDSLKILDEPERLGLMGHSDSPETNVKTCQRAQEGLA